MPICGIVTKFILSIIYRWYDYLFESRKLYLSNVLSIWYHVIDLLVICVIIKPD